MITTIFTRDWVHDLIPAALAYSKGLSQLREHFNATVHAEKMLGGSLTKDDVAPTDQEPPTWERFVLSGS